MKEKVKLYLKLMKWKGKDVRVCKFFEVCL